jgi:hypothetical protein
MDDRMVIETARELHRKIVEHVLAGFGEGPAMEHRAPQPQMLRHVESEVMRDRLLQLVDSWNQARIAWARAKAEQNEARLH